MEYKTVWMLGSKRGSKRQERVETYNMGQTKVIQIKERTMARTGKNKSKFL